MLTSLTISASADEILPKSLRKKYPIDSAFLLIDDLVGELKKSHPGIYRYNSKEEFSRFTDSIKESVNDSITLIELYRKLKMITTKTKCLHTDLRLSDSQSEELNSYPNLLPLQVYVAGARAFIVRNLSADTDLLEGDELLSINERPIPEIINQLIAVIPSDGFNRSLKYRAMYLQFPLWYRNAINVTEHFDLVVKRNSKIFKIALKGRKFPELAGNWFLKEPVREKVLDFRIENNIGFLAIHSFAKTDIKRAGQNFRKFIDQAFTALGEQKIKHLVVDLRDNTGGSDPNAVYFTSHFFDQSFHYGDKTLVTKEIAKQIKGIYRIFYKKPVQKDSLWYWQDGRVKDLNTFAVVKNAKNNYKGKSYILINGFCMSSCANVTAILAHNRKSIFIGQETGGGYQGNNSGMLPEEPISNTGLLVTVPLQAYYLAVKPTVNVGRGTLPDYTVNFSLQGIMNGQDAEAGKAIELIEQSMKHEH
ncbi:Peptidase family S41 [Olivibacter domesticus]|uniref:Peptidase family S41 n=2 Tax=Olivibacter domesticus TaxID=407022 RepID=A0A1H7IHJ8_OLID1|nr:Peptidase family S41 [Olivibacter domesticus]